MTRAKQFLALLLAVSAALILAACGSKASSMENWKDYPLADGSFTVKIPADPTCHDQPIAAGITASMCMTETEHTGMMTSVTKMPAGLGDKVDLNTLLDNAMNGASKNVNGTISSSNDITVNGVKGREFVIDSSKGKVKNRIFFANDTLVHAIGIPKGDEAASKDEIEKFVTSLQPKS